MENDEIISKATEGASPEGGANRFFVELWVKLQFEREMKTSVTCIILSENQKMVKLIRAQGECLGIRSRRRT